MSGHRHKYQRYLKGLKDNTSSFYLFDKYGVENCKIELLELYPCNSKAELTAREGHHQRNNDCVNIQIAGRKKNSIMKSVRKQSMKRKRYMPKNIRRRPENIRNNTIKKINFMFQVNVKNIMKRIKTNS